MDLGYAGLLFDVRAGGFASGGVCAPDPAGGEENVRVWFVLKKNDSDEITNIFYVVMERVISDGVVTSIFYFSSNPVSLN